MTTFQMFNHQLKHMLGGIEAQKNTSIEELESFQKRIVKAMEKAQNCHKKIYQGATMIKSNLNELSENYMGLFKEGKYSGTLIGKVHNEINKFLQEICEESLSLSKKMQDKIENYVPRLKKIKQKYAQSAQTFEHYRQKLQLLKKNIDKQLAGSINKDERERLERNKDKYRNAQKQHDQNITKITKRFCEFNSEGLKDIFHDFVSIISTVGGDIFGLSQRLKNGLIEYTSGKDLLSSRYLTNRNKKIDSMKGQSKEQKTELLNCLIEERQISNFLKAMMEKEMNKIDNSLDIAEAFNKKESGNKENHASFNNFKNHYNSHHLRHNHHSAIDELKEPDPMEVCEDLLSAEQINQKNKRTPVQEGLSKQSSVNSKQSELQRKKAQQNEQKTRNNLQKFNQMCEQNKAKTIVSAKSGQKLKNNNILSKLSPQKQQKTVAVHQFFNFGETKSKKDEILSKPQQQLGKMHEHLFNFNFLAPPPLSQQKKSASTSNNNPKNQNPQTSGNHAVNSQNFQDFDFFAPNMNKNHTSPKSSSSNAEPKTSEMIAKNEKKGSNNFDLLSF